MTNNADGTFTKAYTCPRPQTLAAQSACEADGGAWSTPSGLAGVDDSWDCAHPGTVAVALALSTACSDTGGMLTSYAVLSGRGYFCAAR